MPEAAAAAPKKFALQEYKTEVHVDWCPGCGDFGILSACWLALRMPKTPQHGHQTTSTSGCYGWSAHYIDTYAPHTPHARPLPVATGATRANNQLTGRAGG